MSKSKSTQKTAPIDTRDLTVKQRREIFLKARKEDKPDYQVLTKDFVDELVPYGMITFDHVLGLSGIKRHGFVSSIHGEENVGKCLVKDALITASDGLLYLSEIFERNGLQATNDSRVTEKNYSLVNGEGVAEPTSHFTHNYKRPVFLIKTETGNELKNTANHQHKVLNKAGYWVWKKTSDLKPGDVLVTLRKTETPIGCHADNVTDNELYFIGSAIADAYFGRNRVSISNDDPIVLAASATDGVSVVGTNPCVYTKGTSTAHHFNSLEGVSAFYKKYGFQPGVAKDKCTGSFIRSLSTEQIKHVIQGYIDCECSIDHRGIAVSSASHKLLLEIKIILQTHFGLISVIKPKKVKKYPNNNYWRLALSGMEAIKFNELIGFKSEVRKEEFNRLFDLPNKDRKTNIDGIPNCGVLLESLYDSSETTVEHNFAVRDYKGSNPKSNPSYKRLEEILSLPWADSLVLSRLREIYNANYFYDEIAGITNAGEEPTFDFTLPQTHSFIVNGVISHNSTLTYQIAANYQSFTEEPLGVFDFEGTGTPDYLECIGCDIDMVKLVQPSCMEDAVIETLNLLRQGCRFFIYDSIPWINAEIDEKDIRSKKFTKATYGKHAQTMAQFFKALHPYVKRADGHMLMVNQTRARIDDSIEAQYANDYSYTNKTYVLPGGRICRFTPSVMIEMRMQKAVNPYDGKTGTGPDKDPFVIEPATPTTEGHPCVNYVRVRTLKNKVTGAGFREGFIWIRPATHATPGIDNLMSIRQLARDYGFIQNKGAKWFVGKSFEDAIIVYPNKDAAIEDLTVNRNPDVHVKLNALLVEAIQADTSGRHTSVVTKEELDLIEGEEQITPVGSSFEVAEVVE